MSGRQRSRRRSHIRRSRGFTLVELLVTIGIIAILMAILLPTIMKSRRGAVVLASPVVFMGSDNRVHLTDASGRMDLSLTSGAPNACPVCHTPPSWSPSGLMIGLRIAPKSGGSYTALVEPVSGRIKTSSTADRAFIGWIDSSRYVECADRLVYTIDANTGAQTLMPDLGTQNAIFLAPAPPGSPAPLIGVVYISTGDMVTFLHKDLSPGKPIWTEPRAQGVQSQESPRVDPMGDYVGWTMRRNKRPYVAVKSATGSALTPPSLLGDQFKAAYFCDWNEQGEILANVQDLTGGPWKLVIMDTGGFVKRVMSTSVPPAEGIVATWRKYEHR